MDIEEVTRRAVLSPLFPHPRALSDLLSFELREGRVQVLCIILPLGDGSALKEVFRAKVRGYSE